MNAGSAVDVAAAPAVSGNVENEVAARVAEDVLSRAVGAYGGGAIARVTILLSNSTRVIAAAMSLDVASLRLLRIALPGGAFAKYARGEPTILFCVRVARIAECRPDDRRMGIAVTTATVSPDGAVLTIEVTDGTMDADWTLGSPGHPQPFFGSIMPYVYRRGPDGFWVFDHMGQGMVARARETQLEPASA